MRCYVFRDVINYNTLNSSYCRLTYTAPGFWMVKRQLAYMITYVTNAHWCVKATVIPVTGLVMV